MITLITDNLKQIEDACRRFDVERLWVFGSAVTDRWVEGKSDIDFIAQFGESELSIFRQHMGFIGTLEDLLGTRAHVVDARSIKKPAFREEVEATRELLYAQSHQTVSA